MSDIVERLREWNDEYFEPCAELILEEAADEIERLRNVVKKCQAQFEMYAESHSKKGTPEGDKKAETNQLYVDLCKYALPLQNRYHPRIERNDYE